MQITFDEKKKLDTNPIFHLFVQGENMAESIRIVGPKMVGALDLSQLRMAVRMTNAAYETMVEQTLEHAVTDDDTITLVWNVDRQFTSKPGHAHVMLVGYGNNEEVIKITSAGIEVKEDETFVSAPQGSTWDQILREMQDLATQASASQTAAAASADRAAASEQVAVSKAAEIADAAEQTLVNAEAAAESAAQAAASATLAESWAVGGTGTRQGEDTNNAQYWAQQAQQVSQGALGWYETEQALQAAHPTGTNGQWAIIGSTDTIWTWDSDTSAWVNSGAQVDLSNYYTKAQSDARYATAAQGALAASAVQSVNGLTGPNPTLTAASVGAVQSVNGLTGPDVSLVPELLWTNPAPNAAFEAQTISLDTKEYTYFLVIYSANNGYRSIIAQLGVRQQLNAATYYNFIRPLTINVGQVAFESCQYYGTYGSSTLTTYESGCIPWKIIGLM